MLLELRVRGLGPIDDLTLDPGPAMTVLTGETGAGKTLVVEALTLVLGGRVAGHPVRPGHRDAVVEARFGRDDQEHVLVRTVPTEGRSRAWVDGRMATAQQLAEGARGLVDIHGQHDQYSLTSVTGRRRALDAFAGTELAPLAAARGALEEIGRALEGAGGDPQARAREADVLRFQVAEIEGARVVDADEDRRLAEEEAVLGDLAANREALDQAVAALTGTPGVAPDAASDPGLDPAANGGALDRLRLAASLLTDRPGVTELGRRLLDVTAEVDDVAHELQAIGVGWEDDPGRLEGVQARRHQLAQLRRKYGEDLEEVLAFADSARRRLAELEDADGRLAELEARRTSASADLARAEAQVRGVRAAAAPDFSERATERLRVLAMPRAALEVTVGELGAGDDVEILFGADGRSGRQPIARAASGGELSRAALALYLVSSGGPETMVFDEVDAGVGGQAAVALAAALRDVAEHHQVLVVTHLPQVAAVADTHVALRSVGADGPATTVAEVLDDEGRIVELARMLSGHPDSPTARAHADELLSAWRRPPPGPATRSPDPPDPDAGQDPLPLAPRAVARRRATPGAPPAASTTPGERRR